jgi:membrane-associated phospholipid phosphatase
MNSTATCMTLRSRLLHLLAGWGSVGRVYFSSDLLQGPGMLLPETALDRAIAYSDAAIWLYLSFFILIPYAYLVADAARVRWLARAMALCALACGVVFLLYPSTLVYPPVGDGNAWSTQALRMLQAADSTQNCLPSLHGALTLLCVWALCDRRRLLRCALAVLLGISICYAIIALRRHVSIDLAAGLAVGLAAGMLAKMPLFWSARRTISSQTVS